MGARLRLLDDARAEPLLHRQKHVSVPVDLPRNLRSVIAELGCPLQRPLGPAVCSQTLMGLLAAAEVFRHLHGSVVVLPLVLVGRLLLEHALPLGLSLRDDLPQSGATTPLELQLLVEKRRVFLPR